MILENQILWVMAALILGHVLLAAGVVMTLRSRDVQPEMPVDPAADPALVAEAAEAMDRTMQRLEGLIAQREVAQAAQLDAMRADMAALRSEIEWLAGDRMVEQAVALARTGAAPEAIRQETGLSADAARTLAAFRRH